MSLLRGNIPGQIEHLLKTCQQLVLVGNKGRHKHQHAWKTFLHHSGMNLWRNVQFVVLLTFMYYTVRSIDHKRAECKYTSVAKTILKSVKQPQNMIGMPGNSENCKIIAKTLVMTNKPLKSQQIHCVYCYVTKSDLFLCQTSNKS